MAKDPAEDPRWRDYSLQQMGNSIPFSAQPDEAIVFIWEMARRGERGIRGTAMLQLHRLHMAHAVEIGSDYESLVIDNLTDPTSDQTTRITAIAIVGERRLVVALPAIRQLAQGADRSLQRAAIATLGIIGDSTDRDQCLAASTEQDPGVKAAALGALRRLDRMETQRAGNDTRHESAKTE